jgi:hypothetical protein
MAVIKLLTSDNTALAMAHAAEEIFVDDYSGVVRSCEVKMQALRDGLADTYEVVSDLDGAVVLRGDVLCGNVEVDSVPFDRLTGGDIWLDRLDVKRGDVVTIRLRILSVKAAA